MQPEYQELFMALTGSYQDIDLSPEEIQEIIKKLQEHTRFLESLRVSQDGWAKVLSRVTTDHQDIIDALKANKIIAHIPHYLKLMNK